MRCTEFLLYGTFFFRIRSSVKVEEKWNFTYLYLRVFVALHYFFLLFSMLFNPLRTINQLRGLFHVNSEQETRHTCKKNIFFLVGSLKFIIITIRSDHLSIDIWLISHISWESLLKLFNFFFANSDRCKVLPFRRN